MRAIKISGAEQQSLLRLLNATMCDGDHEIPQDWWGETSYLLAQNVRTRIEKSLGYGEVKHAEKKAT